MNSVSCRMMGEIIGTFKGDLWAHTTFDYLNLVLAMEKVC